MVEGLLGRAQEQNRIDTRFKTNNIIPEGIMGRCSICIIYETQNMSFCLSENFAPY